MNLSTDGKANKVQMAVAYDNEGNPKAYEKFHLECVSVSDGDYRNLFYKFKVIDREIDGKTFAERVNSNERRYDVPGIELMKYGNQTATEYGVNGTYYFTGYAAGYGPDANSQNTLASKVEYLETVELGEKAAQSFRGKKLRIHQGVAYRVYVLWEYGEEENDAHHGHGSIQRGYVSAKGVGNFVESRYEVSEFPVDML